MILTPEDPQTLKMMDALDHFMKAVPEDKSIDPRPIFMATIVFQRIVLAACRDAGMTQEEMVQISDEGMLLADTIINAITPDALSQLTTPR